MEEETGVGVSKKVIGGIWRPVTLGDITAEQQRLVVLSGMIIPVILGADFWCRLPGITFRRGL